MQLQANVDTSSVLAHVNATCSCSCWHPLSINESILKHTNQSINQSFNQTCFMALVDMHAGVPLAYFPKAFVR